MNEWHYFKPYLFKQENGKNLWKPKHEDIPWAISSLSSGQVGHTLDHAPTAPTVTGHFLEIDLPVYLHLDIYYWFCFSGRTLMNTGLIKIFSNYSFLPALQILPSSATKHRKSGRCRLAPSRRESHTSMYQTIRPVNNCSLFF